MNGYLDDDCGCGNRGHGPGFNYDERVGPRGSLLAWWIGIALVAGIGVLFGC